MNKYPGDEGALDAVDYVQQTVCICSVIYSSKTIPEIFLI